MAEIGQVHRSEASGTLHGLFRLREFTQDDAHIYCTGEQIGAAIEETIGLIDEVYKTFGLEYEMELSTRPTDSIGSDEVWAQAEGALRAVLSGHEYKVNAGDGAFYGPKIDFHIKDRMGRRWQCATIQLDFNLPERFELEYLSSDGQYKRPVMIHRVVLGSIERFIGIMTEHFGGAFPIWLAPEQVRILPITKEYESDSEEYERELRGVGLRVKMDKRSETLNKRIKQAALRKVPYTIIIGERERLEGTVNVRVFGQNRSYSISRGEFKASVLAKVERKALEY